MSTLAQALGLARARLTSAGVDNPPLDARLLLEAATGFSRTDLLLKNEQELSAEALMVFGSLIERRCAREPVARILGQREFWGLPFALNEATLEPRPDSETLIEAVLRQVDDRRAALRVVDLGTGTGCLLAALLHELPHAQGVAVDIAPRALEQAQKNLAALELESRAQFVCSHWWDKVDGVFDIVISNPPYLREDELQEVQPEVAQHDPRLALVAGADGLDAYRALLAGLAAHLSKEGVAVLELGAGQGEAVAALAYDNQLKVKEIKADLGGVPRAIIIVKA
jgi:release factor glutamine methyltransferase